jgi:hypothetical protein
MGGGAARWRWDAIHNQRARRIAAPPVVRRRARLRPAHSRSIDDLNTYFLAHRSPPRKSPDADESLVEKWGKILGREKGTLCHVGPRWGLVGAQIISVGTLGRTRRAIVRFSTHPTVHNRVLGWTNNIQALFSIWVSALCTLIYVGYTCFLITFLPCHNKLNLGVMTVIHDFFKYAHPFFL